MFYSLAADAVLVLHLLFILFAVAGGLLLFRWRWLLVLHLPAVVWAVLIEWRSWICPLTPLENYLRHKARQDPYEGGFIEQYLLPVIYPAELTPDIQFILGLFVLVLNVLVYASVLLRVIVRRRRSGSHF